MAIYVSESCAKQLQNYPNKEDLSKAIKKAIRRTKDGEVIIRQDTKLIFQKNRQDNLELKNIEGCPFALLEDEALLQMGIPSEYINHVRCANDIKDFDNLPISDETRENLQKWMVDYKKKQVKSPVYYEAEDEFHLERFYRRDIVKLLLRLEDEQKILVDKQTQKSPILIKGTVGSGKTTIAIYRIRNFADEYNRILYLTYNHTLMEAARTLIFELNGRIPRGVEFSTVHGWCRNFLKEHKKKVYLRNQKELDNILREAITHVKMKEKSRLFERPLSFWKREINDIIKGRAEGDYNKYIKIDRVGCGIALNEIARSIVWEVYEEYEKLKGWRMDFMDVLLETLKLMRNVDYQKYDYVIIDEAQDLNNIALYISINLAKHTSGLFIVADAAQSIYNSGFRWKNMGLTIGSQNVYELKQNHRNSKQILKAAQSLIEKHNSIIGSDDFLNPLLSKKSGPKPLIVQVKGGKGVIDDEIDWIVRDIAQRIETGECICKNIAVITPRKYYAQKIAEVLAKKNISASYYEESIDLNANTIKCISIHSSKGLEFPLVYLLGIDNKLIPGEIEKVDDDEREIFLSQQRKLLYVAMTRAMNELIITCSQKYHSLFLEDIDENLVVKKNFSKHEESNDNNQLLKNIINDFLEFYKKGYDREDAIQFAYELYRTDYSMGKYRIDLNKEDIERVIEEIIRQIGEEKLLKLRES